MRFEKRFLRMQELNKRGIKFLSDLLNYSTVVQLLPALLEAWQNVLIYDIENLQILENSGQINEVENNLLISGQNPKFWEQLKITGNEKFKYQRKKYKKLVAKNGSKWQQLVKELIHKEWKEMFKDSPNLQCGSFPQQNLKFPEFIIKIKSKNGEKRFCLTCGKEITNQKEGSKYCGAKYVGYEAAHQCRNNNNDRKYKIEKIQRRGILVDIIPFIVNSSNRKEKVNLVR